MESSIRLLVLGSPLPLSQKKSLQSIGINLDFMLSDKTTAVIASDAEVANSSSKVLQAKKRGIPLLAPRYITDALEFEKILPFESYLHNPIASSTSPPPPEADTTPTTLPESGPADEPVPLRDAVKTEKISHKPTIDATGGKWRTARIFISSTFKDMHGERDYLTRHVFPELQERAQRLKVHVLPVDLRWGVTSDAANALEVCLTELDSCRPFFLGLLGERYGYVPDSYKVPDEPQFDWLKRTPSGCSVTHLEMEYGALKDPAKAKAAFYFRDPSFILHVPAEIRPDFVDDASDKKDRLEELKKRIRDSGCELFADYPCAWKGMSEGKAMVSGLERFGEHVLETFWRYLQQEFPLENMEADPLQIERDYHQRFIESHSQVFIGRRDLLSKIRSFVEADTPNPMVIVGLPGAGKTSLVSFFAKEIVSEAKKKGSGLVCVPHFIGAAPDSTNIRQSLSRLIKELSYCFEIELEQEVPENVNELQALFSEVLEKIGERDDMRLVLILDALNQLDNTNRAHALEWLPLAFPPNVRVLISTLEGDVYNVLSRRPVQELVVGALSRSEQEEIVTQTLWQYRKKLNPTQMSKLLQKTDAAKPLFLVVACEELRVFGVFEKVTERIDNLAQTVPALFEEVLKRLETDIGRKQMVSTVSLLTCSRAGLLETEMLRLLGEDGDPLPQVEWAKIYRALKNYLRPPGESGEGVLDFFHQQLPKAVKRRYLADKEVEKKVHQKLGTFFWTRADPEKDGRWPQADRRSLNYVAYHQILGQQWPNLQHSLANLAFIEAKCAYGMTFDLVADYLLLSDYQQIIPPKSFEELAEYQRFVTGRAHVLAADPSLTFSMAYALPNDSPVSKQAHRRYYVAGLEQRPFMKWINKPTQANPNIMTLKGHEMIVHCCAYAPPAAPRPLIAAGSDDTTLKLYDAKTGEEFLTLRGHTNAVMSCVFSPDGKRLISAGLDRKVLIWNAETGQVEQEIAGANKATAVAIHPNGNTIATVGTDKNVMIWTRGQSLPAHKLVDAHTRKFIGCAYSPDGRTLAATTEDGHLFLFDANDQYTRKMSKCEHNRAVNTVEFSPDSRYIVTAAEDRAIKLWDAETLTVLKTFTGHKDGVTCAVFSHSGRFILSGSHDNVITLWNIESGEAKSNYIGHTGTVFQVRFSNDDKHIISCSFDRSVKVWEVRESIEMVGHEARILACSFSHGGKLLATGARDKTAKIWDTETGRELRQLTGHTSNVFGICWSPDNRLICTASRDQTLKIWQTDTGALLHTLSGHRDAVRSCAWSPDGKHILSASDDKTLIIWDATPEGKFKQLGTLYGHRREVIACCFSRDGLRAASCSDDCSIKLWDTRKGALNYGAPYVKVATLNGHAMGVKSIAFSPDGAYLVSGAEDATILIWNARNAKIVGEITGHQEEIRGVSFTDDGRYILSGSSDSTIHLWSAVTLEKICSFASFGRLCALDSTFLSQRVFAAGDGSGSLYILTPVGLLDASK